MFLWKAIWFLFHSIVEGLPLIIKKNIIHISQRTILIAAYRNHSAWKIFTPKTDGFVTCVARSAVLLEINIVHIHIFQFWPRKLINHGLIAQSIHRNSIFSYIFKKIRPNDPSCPKTAPNSYTLRIERISTIIFRISEPQMWNRQLLLGQPNISAWF